MTKKELLSVAWACGGLSFVLRVLWSRYIKKQSILPMIKGYYPLVKPNRYSKVIKALYKVRTKKTLDLEHPKTFDEKLQWLKLYDSTPLKTKLADKYLVRDWVAQLIGSEHLVPLLGVWDKFSDIDFSTLPKEFVLKCNHGSGWNVIVRDKDKMDLEGIRAKFEKWLALNYAFISGFELHYRDIVPKIIAEEYIGDIDKNPADYKFHCFDGKPEYLQYNTDRNIEKHYAREVFYNMDWFRQPFVSGVRERSLSDTEKPKSFDKMKELATKLCQDFPYVRVDLYDVNGKIYFGEMTFTSDSGYAPWDPLDTNLMLGEKITLPQKTLLT